MNIGIDIRTLSFRRGGISQYTYNLLKNMLRIDSANTYYLFNYNKVLMNGITSVGMSKRSYCAFLKDTG
jgi:hypothetical protein